MTEKKYILLRGEVLSSIDASSTLPVQSGVLKTALDGKVAVDQGAEQSGKFLMIGTDGKVTPGAAITGVAFSDITGSPSDNTNLATALNAKVDKETGKGLSTNDYTTAEKTKLDGIETAAEVNVIETVKVDGNPLTVTDKTVNVDLSNKVDKNGTDRLMTAAEGTKLASIADGAEVNVNADWTATTGDALILNKPFNTIGTGLTVSGGVLSADTQFRFEVFETLPTAGVAYKQTIALIANQGAGQNVYDEFGCALVNDVWTWERFGTTDFTLDIDQTAAGITINETPLQAATNSKTGLLTAADHATFSGKQDALTFDNTPTSGSSNPVKSSGIYTAIEAKLTRSAGTFSIGYDSNGYYLEQ
ncbi:MAG TPA: hypothetical protein O0X25_04110 [Methanocorpusculum sp.]|nr:hypothetical protein [Methanocorpusculum sp.]HJJ49783.1 hypothetical protein [Methanocorpusculum sp.]HJJ57379.1 hypothetical protein [Methanocorpusculum sp.]